MLSPNLKSLYPSSRHTLGTTLLAVIAGGVFEPRSHNIRIMDYKLENQYHHRPCVFYITTRTLSNISKREEKCTFTCTVSQICTYTLFTYTLFIIYYQFSFLYKTIFNYIWYTTFDVIFVSLSLALKKFLPFEPALDVNLQTLQGDQIMIKLFQYLNI